MMGKVFGMAALAFSMFAAAGSRAAAADHDAEKPAILLVAFGTTTDAGRAAYGNIEAKVKAAFPGSEVKWAYSSRIVRTRLGERGVKVAAPDEAMAELVNAGVKTVLAQSLHVVPGEEYNVKIIGDVGRAKGDATVAFGRPLLWNAEDMVDVAEAVAAVNAFAKADGAAVVWMGHGQESGWADPNYLALEYQFRKTGLDRAFIGLVEGEMTLENAVLPALQASGAKKVRLAPFLVVAGDHAQNDLAGDEDDSWKSILTEAGYEVETAVKGLGEMDGIAAVYVRHLREAQASLEEDGEEE